MWGWIVNVHNSAFTDEVWRTQHPAFYLDDGTPIFEVWFYHSRLQRWFVMSRHSDPDLVSRGVVYFFPEHTDYLRYTVQEMERQAGL